MLIFAGRYWAIDWIKIILNYPNLWYCNYSIISNRESNPLDLWHSWPPHRIRDILHSDFSQMLPRSVHLVRSSFSSQAKLVHSGEQPCMHIVTWHHVGRDVCRWAVQCARAIVRNMHGGTCENVGTSCTVREQWNDAFRTSSVPVFQSNQQRKKEGIQAVVSISASHEIRLFFFFDFFVKKEHENLGSELRTVRRMENRYQKLYNKFYTRVREKYHRLYSL